MRAIFQHRGMRFIFAANLVSMMGSGMNSAAVTWSILQSTHSEVALGTLLMLSTLPALMMLPFTGVIIDREDRRRLVMLLDAGRGLVILAVAILALYGRAQLWHLYLMNIMVSAGFWMFWPTITALVQELTPEDRYLQSNTFLMAGVQGGWLIAGAIVGFAYNRIGLGGILLIDCATYAVSFLCYFAVRSGRHVVVPPVQAPGLATAAEIAEGAIAKYFKELNDGITYLRKNPNVVMIGFGWSLFISAMITQGVVTAPLSDRLLHSGAVGYGWLNGGWGVGAFLSAIYSGALISMLRPRRAVGVAMATLALGMFLVPYSFHLFIAVSWYVIMGSARGVGQIAISSSIMEFVPKHFMGRVQNTFFFVGTALQIILSFLVGEVAHRTGLVSAFAIVAAIYATAFVTTTVPVRPADLEPAVESD